MGMLKNGSLQNGIDLMEIKEQSLKGFKDSRKNRPKWPKMRSHDNNNKGGRRAWMATGNRHSWHFTFHFTFP